MSVSRLDIQQITKLYGTSVLNYLNDNLKVVFVFMGFLFLPKPKSMDVSLFVKGTIFVNPVPLFLELDKIIARQ
jgi:hypothetical protein